MVLIVDARTPLALDALARVAAELDGRGIAVQLRMKGAPEAEILAAARAVAARMPRDARLLLNGEVALARAIAADGVHLPEDGGSAEDARRALAPGALVGASCHDERGIARRVAERADYLVLGPLGDVPGKPRMTDARFEALVAGVEVPVLALGGLRTATDLQRARAAGARGVALQRALLDPSASALIGAALDLFARDDEAG